MASSSLCGSILCSSVRSRSDAPAPLTQNDVPGLLICYHPNERTLPSSYALVFSSLDELFSPQPARLSAPGRLIPSTGDDNPMLRDAPVRLHEDDSPSRFPAGVSIIVAETIHRKTIHRNLSTKCGRVIACECRFLRPDSVSDRVGRAAAGPRLEARPSSFDPGLPPADFRSRTLARSSFGG